MAVIYRQIVEIYDENVMSERNDVDDVEMMMFKEGGTNLHTCCIRTATVHLWSNSQWLSIYFQRFLGGQSQQIGEVKKTFEHNWLNEFATIFYGKGIQSWCQDMTNALIKMETA